MTTDNPGWEGVGPIPLPVAPKASPFHKPAPDRVWSKRERLLVPVSLLLAFLLDRLLLAPLFWREYHLPLFSGLFWLLFQAVFYALHWEKLRQNVPLWLVSGCTAALCLWNLLFDYGSEYGAVTLLVIPGVVMAVMTVAGEGYSLNQPLAIVAAWLGGWLEKPFTALSMFFGVTASIGSADRKSRTRKVAGGAALSLLMIAVILPLLGSADAVFRYYTETFLGNINPFRILAHAAAIAVAFGLLYSFLWNMGEAPAKPFALKRQPAVDSIVSYMVLGTVNSIYALFCLVQFTYLFAGAGLPDGMTYSEYAREGFAQIIVICAINLALFGFLMQYGGKSGIKTALLALLLGLSGVMLVSGFLRLRLYIDTYGMTWLRLLSAWFILYLGAVLLLAAVRMAWNRLPLIAVSAFVLLGWYVALGYRNPDAYIVSYNLRQAESPSAWVEKNSRYLRSLSDDALLVVWEQDPSSREQILDTLLVVREQSASDPELVVRSPLNETRYNRSSRRLSALMEEAEKIRERTAYENSLKREPVEVEETPDLPDSIDGAGRVGELRVL